MRMQCDVDCVKRNGIHLIICVLQAPLSPADVPFNMVASAMNTTECDHVPNEWMQ
jgi:hypothetical protein